MNKRNDKDFFRNLLYIFFFFFFAGFTVLSIALIAEFGIDAWQAFGLGAAGGIFLKMLSDGWQFYFRKAPNNTEGEGKK